MPAHHVAPTHRARAIRLCSLLAFAGLAAPALAQDWHWTGAASQNWSNPANWLSNSLPSNGGHVYIGSLAGVENDTVRLDIPETIGQLRITDGMMLLTTTRSLTVSGDTLISGANSVDYGDFSVYHASKIVLGPVDGNSFITDDLTLADGGEFELTDQAYSRVSGVLSIADGCALRGDGSVGLYGVGTSVNNNGRIDPGTETGLRLQQLAGGLFDLDGTSGNGRVRLNTYDTIGEHGVSLRLDGTGLADSFSGELMLASGSDLFMNLSNGWTADAACTIWAHGFEDLPDKHCVIRGGPFNLGADLSLTGAYSGHLRIESSVLTILPEARISLNPHTLADFASAAGSRVVVRGGSFSIGEGAEARFLGPTEWDGSIVADGILRQQGDATVTGPTLIDAEAIDLDGGGLTTWNINNSLVINTARIDTNAVPKFDGVINILGGFLPRLTLNLDDSAASWDMHGRMNLSGDQNLFVNRLGGSPVAITGELHINSGKVVIASNVDFSPSGVTEVATNSTILKLTGASTVRAGTTFLGQGGITNGFGGRLTLEDGSDLGNLRLLNQALLQIGESGPASASVKSLACDPEATLRVKIGGPTRGADHDGLSVDGDVQLGGKLDVDLIDLGAGVFLPQVGDSFDIIQAGGSLSGAFLEDPVSFAGGNVYEWKVIQAAKHVVLLVDQVRECVGDFDEDGMINTIDIVAFLNAWNLHDPSADINVDGVINTLDVIAFMNFWTGGC